MNSPKQDEEMRERKDLERRTIHHRIVVNSLREEAENSSTEVDSSREGVSVVHKRGILIEAFTDNEGLSLPEEREQPWQQSEREGEKQAEYLQVRRHFLIIKS